jgi:hypothetical protein
VAGTLNATFYITGVQLEKGSTATSFDYRPYGTELALCQRYYEKSYNIGTVPGTATEVGKSFGGSQTQGASTTTGFLVGTSQFKVSKRATATVTLYDFAGNSGKVTADTIGVSSANNQTAIVEHASENGFQATRSSGGTACNSIAWQYTASAEL